MPHLLLVGWLACGSKSYSLTWCLDWIWIIRWLDQIAERHLCTPVCPPLYIASVPAVKLDIWRQRSSVFDYTPASLPDCHGWRSWDFLPATTYLIRVGRREQKKLQCRHTTERFRFLFVVLASLLIHTDIYSTSDNPGKSQGSSSYHLSVRMDVGCDTKRKSHLIDWKC